MGSENSTGTNSGTGSMSPWAQNILDKIYQPGFNSNVTGTNTNTPNLNVSSSQPTANLGANLSPQFYDPAIASQLPSNMSGGGGGVVSGYGNAPWVNQWQRNLSGQMMRAGPDPSVNWSGGNNYFNTPAGMYNPYLGQSSVMGVPGAVYNPYGGFNPQINSYANGVDSYLNQLRAPQYPPTEPTTDTSPGSPFAGQQVVHGNTAGWQRSDQDAVAPAQTPYQAAPGTQVDPGVQAQTLGRRELMRQQMMRRWQDSPFFQRNRTTPYNFWGR